MPLEENTMFGIHSDSGYVETLPGISVKTLCHGASTLMSEFRLKAGAALPEHSHPHEQIGYLVSGRMKLHVGASSRELRPGDSWCVPGGLLHRAEIYEDSVAIEIFSPVREDYLEYLHPTDLVE